jgi:hypothetical protein
MKNRLLLSLICICVGITACEITALPIDVESAETKLALSSYVIDSLLVVSVSRSFSALSAEDVDSLSSDFIQSTLADRAQVIASYTGLTDTLSAIDGVPGLYVLRLQQLDAFQDMQISVFDSSSGLSAHAESRLIPGVELDSVFASMEISEADTTVRLYFDLRDPQPNVENFFVFHAYNLPDFGNNENLDDFLIEDVFLPGGQLLFYERLLTDRSSETDSVGREVVLPFTSVSDSVVFVLSHIDEGYYRFLQARARTGGLLSSLANEPVNHPTNVVNGYGYFSAHQPRSVLLRTTIQN